MNGLYGVQNANKFAADIFVRIEEYEKDLEELTATITVYCALLGCPEVIDDTQVHSCLIECSIRAIRSN